jgi:ribosomal protein S18 acetylase RimI-like enzyme
MDDLTFQRAKLEDSADILALLQCISSWLAGKGIDQWKDFYNEKGKATLARRFREGEVYKIAKGGAILGVFVTQWDDTFWHPMKNDDLACYIHTMGIDPSLTGKGIGKKILSFVEDIAKRAGRKYVRLDCNADNARLCEFYESNGFYKAGSKPWENWNVRLYEKKL